MSASNVTLLPSTQGEVSVTGTPVRGSGSTRSVGSLYTVQIVANNLQGRVYIEGTLASNPTEDDWFVIVMPGVDATYVEFPYDGGLNVGGQTSVGFTFKGNFAWIRARLDRAYLGIDGLSSGALAAYGYLDEVVLNISGWTSSQSLVPGGSGSGFISGIESVRGNNLGTGERIYANSVGQSDVLLNYKTLIEGDGIRLTSDSTSITIESLGGGDGTINAFTELQDAPGTITANAIVFGGSDGNLHFTNSATSANTVLMYNGAGSFQWKNLYTEIASSAWNLAVNNAGSNVTANARTLNFSGDVSVAANGTTTNITVGDGGSRTEYVYFQYTAGSSGTLNANDAIIEASDGVTATITDAVNCVVEFTFTNRDFPPSSIALMGQAFQTNEFNYTNVHAGIATRKVAGGGTSSAPTFLGAFAGPVTLQIRMTDTSASAFAGQRAKAVVMFRF